jgi:GMP synthase (glutamine-hydrolysing)
VKFGGGVHQGSRGGYGPIEVEICENDDILWGYPKKIDVWASHADEVSRIPDGFTCLAHSAICGTEAIAQPEKHIYGLQWHPEVSHTFEGKRVFENFNRITIENQT